MSRLVYLSPVPWDSFAQRPHRFVEWFHRRHGGEVLWIDPYATRLPRADDLRRLTTRGLQGGTGAPHPAWMQIYRPVALPLEPLPALHIVNRWLWRGLWRTVDAFVPTGAWQLVIGKPSRLALQMLARYPEAHSVFDAMDDFPAFYSSGLSRRALARHERQLARAATRIAVSSHALADRFAAEHAGKVVYVPNACDAHTLPSPSARRDGRIVLGYVGTISHWFDWDWIIALAHARPDAEVRLIGPRHCAVPESLPPNIVLCPACPHAEALRAMEEFSVGLIPFLQTPLTRSVDPIKYYEYRALSLPVMSTEFGEMPFHAQAGGVFLCRANDELGAIVAKALQWHDPMEQVAQFRLANDWAARFDTLLTGTSAPDANLLQQESQ